MYPSFPAENEDYQISSEKNNKYVKHLYTTRKRYINTQDDRTMGAKVYWLKFLCIHMTPEPWALKQKKYQHHIPRLMKN